MERTRNLLHEALGSLIAEKPYGAIAVKDILDRANVGRSTFYTHFRDKDELLVSGIQDMLRASTATACSARRSEQLIQFSLPLFEHIARHRAKAPAAHRLRSADWTILHDRLRQVLGARLAEDLTTPASARVPRDLLVRYVTSSFILVLDWWMKGRSALSPAEVNDVFRALVLPTLTGAVD